MRRGSLQSRRPWPAGAAVRRPLALAALGLTALVTTGCSVKGGDDANVIEGKKQFVAKCGVCHTLAHADTKGVVGPNLDEAFRASVDEGLGRSTIRGVVEDQIQNPNPNGAMPKNLVSAAVRRDIAAYVSQVAAAPGKDTGLLASAVEPVGAGKPAVEKGGKLSIEANPTGQLAYVTDKATATPGQVTIEMPNMSGVMHNIAIEAGEHGASPSGPVLAAGQFTSKGVSKVSLTLKPGVYTFFCQAPGHRAAGMYGTITVK